MNSPEEIQHRNRPEDCPYPSADDDEIITPILDELDAPEHVRELAVQIASTVESTMWVVGKRRYTVAATAVYVAGKELGGTQPVFTQSEVAEASKASIGSLIKYHDELQTIFNAIS